MTNELPNDEIGDALRLYIEQGSDLSKAMEMDFFVSAPDATAAYEIARKVASLGFITSAEYDEESGEWTCYCTKTLIPEHKKILALEQLLNDASKEFGGFSDGFGSYGNAE